MNPEMSKALNWIISKGILWLSVSLSVCLSISLSLSPLKIGIQDDIELIRTGMMLFILLQ